MIVYTKQPAIDTEFDRSVNANYSSDRCWECLEELAAYPVDAMPPDGFDFVENYPPGPYNVGNEYYFRTVCYAGPQFLIRRYRVAAQASGYGPRGRIANGQRLY